PLLKKSSRAAKWWLPAKRRLRFGRLLQSSQMDEPSLTWCELSTDPLRGQSSTKGFAGDRSAFEGNRSFLRQAEIIGGENAMQEANGVGLKRLLGEVHCRLRMVWR